MDFLVEVEGSVSNPFFGYGVSDGCSSSYIKNVTPTTKKVSERKCANGDTFTGTVDVITGDIIHGKRIYIHSAEIYEGPFVRGKRHGVGAICTKLDGSGKYLGSFVNDEFETGTLVTSEFSYSGSFGPGNVFHGNGILVDSKGTVYKGDFKMGLFEGEGILERNVTPSTSLSILDVAQGRPASSSCISDMNIGESYTGGFLEGLYNGNGTLNEQMSDGTTRIYNGTWVKGRKEGKGNETLPNGEIYMGQFRKNLRQGVGKLITVNGMVMEGSWIENLPVMDTGISEEEGPESSGKWKISYTNDIKYEGQIQDLRPHGSGTMRYKVQEGDTGEGEAVYTGEFKNGMRHGFGQCIFPLGQEYSGDWIADEPVSLEFFRSGIFNIIEYKEQSRESDTLATKSSSAFSLCSSQETEIAIERDMDELSIESSWSSSSPYAKDECHSNTDSDIKFVTEQYGGSTFKGKWLNTLRHGQGVLKTNFMEYTGDFHNGKRTGHGSLVLVDSSSFVGEFLNGEFHGSGAFTDRNSRTMYTGKWKIGLRHGMGKETYADGSVYEGEFRHGKRHGMGELRGTNHAKDNIVYNGNWVHGVMCGKGVWEGLVLFRQNTLTNPNRCYDTGDSEDPDKEVQPQHCRYDGTFNRGLRSGRGTLFTAHGESLEGRWLNDEPVDGDWVLNYKDGSTFFGIAKCSNSSKESGVPLLIPSGFGTMKYSNGDLYSGTFIDGKREGSGLCQFANGNQSDGEWTRDSFTGKTKEKSL